MRIAITGGRGQLGSALVTALRGHTVAALDLPELDITRPDLGYPLARFAPEVVIHCAAMTNVDGCARDPDAAFRVNALGTRNVALACRALGADLVAISTNEVFDGQATRPYAEWDTPRPINAYGASKLAGEGYVRELVPNAYIVRTAWVFGGASSFVTRMLDLAASGAELAIVTDEVANPTYAQDLAAAIGCLIETRLYGTYHLVNEGIVSRHDYALEVFRLAGLAPVVRPITLAEYRRDSSPPPYSPLRNFVAAEAGIRLRPWQEALRDHLHHLGRAA